MKTQILEYNGYKSLALDTTVELLIYPQVSHQTSYLVKDKYSNVFTYYYSCILLLASENIPNW